MVWVCCTCNMTSVRDTRGLGVVEHVEYVNAVWFRYERMFWVVCGSNVWGMCCCNAKSWFPWARGVHVVNCNSRGLGVMEHVEYVNAVWFRYELMFYVVFGWNAWGICEWRVKSWFRWARGMECSKHLYVCVWCVRGFRDGGLRFVALGWGSYGGVIQA